MTLMPRVLHDAWKPAIGTVGVASNYNTGRVQALRKPKQERKYYIRGLEREVVDHCSECSHSWTQIS